VFLVQHRTVEDEVTATADFLSAYLKRRSDLRPGQLLVLTPRRFIGHAVRAALIRRGLNALSYFFEDELKQPSAAEGFCLLTLLVEPSDRPALRAWLNLGQRNGGHAAGYGRVRGHAHATGQTPQEVCEELGAGRLILPHTDGVKERYQELVRRLQSLHGLSGLDLVRALWSPADDTITDIRIAAERIALDAPDPQSILEQLSEDITQPELPGADSDIIRVMSLHKSKGLTAACVAVVGCVAGALPTVDVTAGLDEQESAREEQRRLFYVAITRATDTLVVSSSSMMEVGQALRAGIEVQRRLRVDGSTYARTIASPYLAELGAAAPHVLTTREWREAAEFVCADA
jgi:DNA helicase II / ATP-dependent DNA helicase PcrA